jgi:hypothetical protein
MTDLYILTTSLTKLISELVAFVATSFFRYYKLKLDVHLIFCVLIREPEISISKPLLVISQVHIELHNLKFLKHLH